MLVLSRRIGEEIVIGEQIRVVVMSIQKERVRLGICAPGSLRVDRLEVHERRTIDQCTEECKVEKVVP
jgi:carbon storage regulator